MAQEVELYEDNGGGLHLAYEGRAACLDGMAMDGMFVADVELIIRTSGLYLDVLDQHTKSADELIEQTQLSHDATRHVATWTPEGVVVHEKPGAAAFQYLGRQWRNAKENN